MKCPHCEGTGVAPQDFEPMVKVRAVPADEYDQLCMLRALDEALPAATVIPDTVLTEIINSLINLGYMKLGS